MPPSERLCWTKERPKVPGFYFMRERAYRLRMRSPDEPARCPEDRIGWRTTTVDVLDVRKELSLMVDGDWVDLEELDPEEVEFAGPIPLPEEQD
jgi:hypothetical protein